MRAVVVGGGIGGLAAAVGLRRIGWDVAILERSEHPGEIGAGISLWPNGLAALSALDVWPDLAEHAAMPVGGVRRPDGRWLSRMDAGIAAKLGVLLVHRRELHAALRAALPQTCLVAGADVTLVETGDARTLVRYTHAGRQRAEPADLVVAADGLQSDLRSQLWPEHPGARYAGFTAWRGVTSAAFPLAAAAETWGRGCEFGATLLADAAPRVYWFATANLPPDTPSDDERAEVLRRFGDWHEPIRAIVEATDPDAVLRHDIYELARPLPEPARGRVVLLGDAAHAMTPNLGQGACLALEDAVELAALLGGMLDVDAALRQYAARRRPRTQRLAAMSARAGRTLQAHNPATVAIRNDLVRVMPARLAARGTARAIAWRAPSLPPNRLVADH